MTTFPLMPACVPAYVPKFSQTLVWEGSMLTNPSFDVSPYVLLPYSSIVVIQLYGTGGEPFYYPPTAKLNGSDMPLVSSTYTNAFDDGNAAVVSVSSVSHGEAALVTWGTSAAQYALIYVVTGFRDMFSSLYDTAASVNLTSGNDPCPPTTTVDTTANSRVIFISIGGITTDVDISGQMDSFITTTSGGYGLWEIGWDYSTGSPTKTYNGGNRMALLCSFNLSEIQ